MKEETDIKTDKELFLLPGDEADKISKISITRLKAGQLRKHLYTNTYMRSTMFILVLEGSATIEINFRKDVVNRGVIILLSFGHFFKIVQLSSNFRCEVLYTSKEYIDKMYSADLLYKRVKYGVKMHQTPLLHLKQEEYVLLAGRMDFIRDIVNNDAHRYYQDMILNAITIFFLDLMHIIENENNVENAKQSRDQHYFKDFMDLLVLHYKSQHQVDFYAGKLHITTHYLTLIVKRLSGQSVSNLILQLLYSEAKILLQQPDFLIKQIASDLNFSDQSSFGKFFKRFSGISPKQYKQDKIG
jgi:AraC family transcriptional activator of pobA